MRHRLARASERRLRVRLGRVTFSKVLVLRKSNRFESARVAMITTRLALWACARARDNLASECCIGDACLFWLSCAIHRKLEPETEFNLLLASIIEKTGGFSAPSLSHHVRRQRFDCGFRPLTRPKFIQSTVASGFRSFARVVLDFPNVVYPTTPLRISCLDRHTTTTLNTTALCSQPQEAFPKRF